MTLKQALEKLEQILSNPKYPQIKNNLVRFDDMGEPIGKCAYGEMGCQLGLIKSREDYGYDLYDMVNQTLGFPDWMITGGNLPVSAYRVDADTGTSSTYFPLEVTDDFDCTLVCGSNIMSYIVNLNDAGYSYSQIIEFMKTTFGDLDE